MCPTCRRTGIIHPFNSKVRVKLSLILLVHTSAKDYSKLTPYILAIIKLDEGPRLTSQVICDHSKIHIGMKVKSVFRKLGEESDKGMIYYGTKFVPMESKV